MKANVLRSVVSYLLKEFLVKANVLRSVVSYLLKEFLVKANVLRSVVSYLLKEFLVKANVLRSVGLSISAIPDSTPLQRLFINSSCKDMLTLKSSRSRFTVI